MRRLLPLLFLSVSLFPLRALAQEAVALSLKECVDYALKNSAAAKNALIDVELQKAQNAEVTGRALPQISAQGRFQYYTDPLKSLLPNSFFAAQDTLHLLDPNGYTAVPFTPVYNSNIGISANQLIFNGSILVALQAKKTLMELARQSATMKEEDIRYNIQKSYYALMIAGKQFELLKSSLALVRKGNNDLKATYNEGLVERLEVDRSEVQVSNLESDSMGIANLIIVSEQLLKYNMGMNLNTPIQLTDTSLLNNTELASNLLLQEENYENISSYKLLTTTLKLKKYDLKRYRYEGLPTLSAFGSAGYNYAGATFKDVTTNPYLSSSFIGLQLDVPIFDGWQRRSRVKAAKLNIQKTENDLDNLKLGIDFQTKSARTTLSNSLQTLASRERTMKLANSVYDLTQKKYKAGVGSNQDVILAQADWLNAQNNYFSAFQSVINAQADLQKSLGLLK